MCPRTPLTKYYVPFSKTHSSFIYKKAVWPIWKKKLRKSSKMLPKCEKWENHTFQKYTVHVLWEQAVNLFEIKTSLLALWIWNIFLANTLYISSPPPPIKILKENLWKSTNQTSHSFCYIGFFCKKLLYMDFNICTFMSKIYMYMPYACILDLLDV